MIKLEFETIYMVTNDLFNSYCLKKLCRGNGTLYKLGKFYFMDGIF